MSRIAIGGQSPVANHKIATSEDLDTWTDQTFGPFSGTIWGLTYDDGLWVAVGSAAIIGGNILIATSSDAETWAAVAEDADYTATTIGAFHDVAWNGDEWVAVGEYIDVSGSDTILSALVSSDGVTWTARDILTIPTPASGTPAGWCVAWADDLWVVGLQTARDENSEAILTSADGTTWTARSSPFDAGPPVLPGHPKRGGECNGVAYGAGLWVAVGRGTKAIATSPDGTTWTGRTSPIPDDDALSAGAVAWNGSLFVVAASDGNGGDPIIVTSPDGTTWTAHTTSVADFATAVDVVWDSIDGRWVVLTDDSSNRVLSSADGASWSAHSESVISASGLRAVTAGPEPTVGGWGVGQIRMGAA